MVTMRDVVFVCLSLAMGASATQKVEGETCSLTGYRSDIPPILLTKETWETVANIGVLYLKAWDPNIYEETGMRCARLRLDTGDFGQEKAFLLQYIADDGSVKVKRGNGGYKYDRKGIAIDFDENMEGTNFFMSLEREENARMNVLDISSTEMITTSCFYEYNWWTPTKYYSTYYWSSDPATITTDQSCIDDLFAQKYEVPAGHMKVIDMDECETFYEGSANLILK